MIDKKTKVFIFINTFLFSYITLFLQITHASLTDTNTPLSETLKEEGDLSLDLGAVAVVPNAEDILPVLKLDGVYQFSKENDVLPSSVILNGEAEDNFEEYLIEFARGEMILVEFLDGDFVLVSLRLHEDEEGIFPEQLLLSKEEFLFLDLDYVSPGDIAYLYEKDDGYDEPDTASTGGAISKPRKHRVKGAFSLDRNGRIVGKNGNCVAVVKHLTGFSGSAGNGRGFANALLNWRGQGYKTTNYANRKKGTVCSWNGGWHGKGHVGWFDGNCFQPTYNHNCGQPGSKYRLRLCVSK